MKKIAQGKMSINSPVIPGKPLSITEFKNWMKAAEHAPSISFNEAKLKWENKRNQLENLTNDRDDFDAARKYLAIEERTKYLAGEGRSYSWEEVKNMAINNKRSK